MNKTLLKKTSLCIFFSCIVTLVSAQITIQGKILNAETKQPVENASVYFNNTQIGATSDEKGQFKLYTKRLYSDLVISAIGYESKTVNTSANLTNYTILLKEKTNSLMEVTVSTGKNDWNKWGDLFSMLLLGNNPFNRRNCKIMNPNDIKFYYDEDKQYLEVIAEKPILIKNSAMDCLVHLDIYEFGYHFTDDNLTYSSYAYYDGFGNKPNKSRQLAIKVNYLGSRMHFYRSLYANTLEKENFQIYRYTAVKNIERENVFRAVQQYRAAKMAAGRTGNALLKLSDNPDSASYYKKVLMQSSILKWDTTRVDYKQFLSFDSLNHKMTFKFNDTLMVVYKRNHNMLGGLTMLRLGAIKELSTVDLKTLLHLTDKEGVEIDPMGYVTPNWLLMTGDMGNRRLAEQLPYDFIYSP